MLESRLTVRTLANVDEYRQFETLQGEIWGAADALQITPFNVLLTAQKNGGLVAAAFDDGKMVGILFGFIGLTPEGKFKHCSHLLGVLPGRRGQNIGRKLKLFQRDYVLRQGLDLITWTYDPLGSANAWLNIARLGCVSNTYYPDLYADSLDDELNRGIPTDRFQVDWWIASPRVRQFVDGSREPVDCAALIARGARQVIDTRLDHAGLLCPADCHSGLDARELLVEIPVDFLALKRQSLELAREWRQITASMFIRYFAQGYAVTDFLREERRNFYVLTQESAKIPKSNG